jgi:hypothetical protein
VVSSEHPPAAWAAALALAIGCRAHKPSLPTAQPAKVPSMSSDSSSAVRGALAVAPAATLPWSDLPSAQLVEVGPPTGGAYETPGPKPRPVRPWLELAGSPAGVAALVMQGGAAGTHAVHGARVAGTLELRAVPIALGALAVSARRDGLWVMYRDRLVAVDLAGAVQREVGLSAVALIGSTNDAVWLAGQEQAWHVDPAGAVRGPYPWRAPLVAFGDGEALCARDKRDARALVCLLPDGGTETRRLAFELLPLEQPVAIAGDLVITVQGPTVRRRRRGGELVDEHTLQAAGVDGEGSAFAVSAVAGGLALWRQATEGRAPRRLPRVGPGSISAAAIAGDEVMLYGQGQALRQRGDAPAELAEIDEEAYRAAIFPAAWSLSPRRAVAVWGEAELGLAASGPTGVAVLPLGLGSR